MQKLFVGDFLKIKWNTLKIMYESFIKRSLQEIKYVHHYCNYWRIWIEAYLSMNWICNFVFLYFLQPHHTHFSHCMFFFDKRLPGAKKSRICAYICWGQYCESIEIRRIKRRKKSLIIPAYLSTQSIFDFTTWYHQQNFPPTCIFAITYSHRIVVFWFP